MSAEPLLVGHGVSKRFRIKENRSLSDLRRGRSGPRELWALRDVDLTVVPGEVLAVVGRNGAGKSTLLKLCGGISEPTEGTVVRPKRIAPLIEVGAGFHPELSGRENIGINARLLGLSRTEVRSCFDDIVDFSDLGDSIDRPVRQYSSGMFMRLGFSVAIHTRPELLIVDEVLAVGDLPFQSKCLDRIRVMREDGVGVLFVSHNINAVLTTATRALFLVGGRVSAQGDTAEVVGAYHRSLNAPEAKATGPVAPGGELVLEAVTAVDESGTEPPLWQPGSRGSLTLRLRARGDVPACGIGYNVTKDGSGRVARWAPTGEDATLIPALADGAAVDVTLGFSVNLAEGGYTVDVATAPLDFSYFTLVATSAYRFGVDARPGGTGIADLAPELMVRHVE
jgi:ABC-type polysaccharide/polyol phosphate transport system ATPase subunit